MEKSIKWEGNEAMMMQGLDQKKTQALAQIGALMMDLETAKKNLEAVNEEFKSAIRNALASRGINQVETARPVPGGLIVNIPDVPESHQLGKPNGGA